MFGEAEIGVIEFRIFATDADELGLVVSARIGCCQAWNHGSSIWVEKVEHVVLVSTMILFNVNFYSCSSIQIRKIKTILVR